MFFKIQKSKKDELQSQFSQLNQQLFTLLLFSFHANHCKYQIKSNYCTYSYTSYMLLLGF